MKLDLVVVGGGAAGLAAVRTARWAGADVALVTDGPPGGDCTFTGCVPSKTLLAQARRGADFDQAMGTVRDTVERVAATESVSVLQRGGVTVVEGRARLVTHDSVAVGDQRLSAPRIVIATGARPAVPSIAGLDEVPFLTSDTVFDLTSRPTTMAVVGGGAIGCELAFAMAGLGVGVDLLEAADRLLPDEEPEASAAVARALRRRHVEIRTGVIVRSVRSGAGTDVFVDIDGPHGNSRVVAQSLLLATGRLPNSADLGLDALGVRRDGSGAIQVDDRMATRVRGVYAAGDVTGLMDFTHAADEMGRLAAANALGEGHRGRFRRDRVPWAVFTEPELARVGMTEAQAARRGGRVAFLPLAELDRAVTEGTEDGFVKLIAGPHKLTRRLYGGRIVGATIVAPRAGEMIHEPALAMLTGMFVGRLAQLAHAYPTWSHGIQKTAAQFFGPVEGREARPARTTPTDES